VETQIPMRYGDGPGVLAIAHRGGAGLAAENTMDAFARSHALGLRYLETDVRLTADGVLVAFHDANLERVTDGHGPVSKADLRRTAAAACRQAAPHSNTERGAPQIPGRMLHDRPQG
jgi:glycerophosphoryl diester phosphodiesterase